MIYLDNAATTKPDKECLLKAEIYNTEKFFNPSSLYREGLELSDAVKQAKNTILDCLGLSSALYEVVFTSGGTESDNTAVFSSVKRGTFVTDKGEHAAIFQCFTELKNRGYSVNFIDVNKDGSADTEKLYDFVRKNRTDFVSVMHVNNETGAINDVNSIAEELKKINPDIVFHTDGVQSFGKIPFVFSNSIDMFSLSGHKINAVKGTGALIKKRKLPFSPIIFGGGQENGLRSGTENTFGIKVLEFNCRKKYENIRENFEKVSVLNEYVRKNIDLKDIKIISSENSSPYILCLSAVGLRGEVIMHALEEYGIIIGNGSACSSRHRYSRVIEACGYEKAVLDGVLRISFSADNTMEEVAEFTDRLNFVVKKFKRIMK